MGKGLPLQPPTPDQEAAYILATSRSTGFQTSPKRPHSLLVPVVPLSEKHLPFEILPSLKAQFKCHCP